MISFLSWFLIPALSVFLPGRESWFTSNFSAAARHMPTRCLLILWCLITVSCFRRQIRDIVCSSGCSAKTSQVILASDISSFLLFLAVLLPYQPDKWPFFARLHVSFALAACVLFYVTLLSLAFRHYFSAPKVFSRLTSALVGSVIPCVLLFWMSDFLISSAMEIFCTVFASFWLFSFRSRVLSIRYSHREPSQPPG